RGGTRRRRSPAPLPGASAPPPAAPPRHNQAVKHGGGARRLPLEEFHRVAESPEDLLDLDDVLTRFAAEEPDKARPVQLRFFAGLSAPDAAALGISVATAERWWAFARAWLYSELQGGEKNLPMREGGGPIFRIEGKGIANAEPGHEPAITGGSHFSSPRWRKPRPRSAPPSPVHRAAQAVLRSSCRKAGGGSAKLAAEDPQS